MLVRLLYASRAVPGLAPDAVAALVRRGSAANPARGITGVLCFGDGVFLQVLEGGRAAVNRLYARIVADPRHTGVELLLYDGIGERRFAGHALGYIDLAHVNPGLLLKYSAGPVLDPFAVAGAMSLALLEELLVGAAVSRCV